MKNLYLLILSTFVIGSLFSQNSKITQQVTIPLYAQSGGEQNYIPVQKGSQFSLQTNFIAPAKKTFLSKLLKGTGMALAGYQSTRVIESSIKKESINNNWLLPVGIGVSVTGDKLIPQKHAKTFLRYNLYDNNKQLITTNLFPVGKEQTIITGEAPVDGYITAQLTNNTIQNGSIDVTVTAPEKSAIAETPLVKENIIEQEKPSLQLVTPDIVLANVATPIVTVAKENQIVPAISFKSQKQTVNSITLDGNIDKNNMVAIAPPILVKTKGIPILFQPIPERQPTPIEPILPKEAILPKKKEIDELTPDDGEENGDNTISLTAPKNTFYNDENSITANSNSVMLSYPTTDPMAGYVLPPYELPPVSPLPPYSGPYDPTPTFPGTTDPSGNGGGGGGSDNNNGPTYTLNQDPRLANLLTPRPTNRPVQVYKIEAPCIPSNANINTAYVPSLSIDTDGSNAPGALSQTTFQNNNGSYLDASNIAYVALPQAVIDALGAQIGSMVLLTNASSTGQGQQVWAIIGDIGNGYRMGEISLYAAQQLGFNDATYNSISENDSIEMTFFGGAASTPYNFNNRQDDVNQNYINGNGATLASTYPCVQF